MQSLGPPHGAPTVGVRSVARFEGLVSSTWLVSGTASRIRTLDAVIGAQADPPHTLMHAHHVAGYRLRDSLAAFSRPFFGTVALSPGERA